MPLYEYQCDSCGHRFEVIQKYSDPPITVCPKCGGGVHKLFSSPAIQFKGSGFYITDYARAGKSEGEGGSSAGKAEKSDAGEKKTPAGAGESQSATKSESKDSAKSDKKSGKSEKTSASKAASD